jgi:hypothetical protein
MKLSVGQPVVIGSLRLELVRPEELRLSGTLLDAAAQRESSRHLKELHARISDEKIAMFTVDVRGLDNVNSSAMRLFVDWIARAEAAPYKLLFKTDRKITWQRLSFQVLRSLAPNNVELDDQSVGRAKGEGHAR